MLACVASLAALRAPTGEFADDLYFYGAKRPAALREMEGKTPPALTLKDWIGEAQDLEKLKGKVVIVDFWGTWCPPCMRSIPHNVQLYNQHKDDGLMFIGVHDSKRGHEKMASVAKDKMITYPLAVDNDGASTKAWHISFWPTYFVIDRKGTIRAAGLTPENVEKVVEKLLKEEADG
jgi:thiol-disulfide isomerase/thioredoxin